MLDLFLNVFVIVAPFVLSGVFIIIPSKTERPRAYRHWCVGLLVFGIAFSVLSGWQQHRLAVESANDKSDSVAREKQSQQEIIDEQKTRIDALQKDVDRQGSAALISANKQFATTLRSMNGVVSIARSAADLSSRNLAAISGYDSYPCLNSGAVKDSTAVVQVTNFGPNPLTGVQLKIYPFKKDNQVSDHYFFMPATDIGTISAHRGKLVPGGLKLRPEDQDTDGVYRYNVEITAQNGVYNEAISFRSSVNGWTEEHSESANQWNGLSRNSKPPLAYVFARCQQPPYSPNEKLPDGFRLVP